MPNKYHAKKVMLAGKKYDSLREARYSLQLDERKKAGKIADYQHHPRFNLIPAFSTKWGEREREANFTPDFLVTLPDGTQEVHEVKSPATKKAKDYILRRKLFRNKYPDIHYVEVV